LTFNQNRLIALYSVTIDHGSAQSRNLVKTCFCLQ
jgi:hypothetical protein